MEVKKTYEYSVYKSVSLTINFKDEEEYSTILEELNHKGHTYLSDYYREFCKQTLAALKS